ncbi:MAG: hypothetical protein AABW72_00965 [archaeon]
MKCEKCGSEDFELKREGYFCKKCKKKQSQKSQYTYPLADDADKYAGR